MKVGTYYEAVFFSELGHQHCWQDYLINRINNEGNIWATFCIIKEPTEYFYKVVEGY